MAYSNKKSTRVGSNIFAGEATANVDYKYGPYTSLDEAFNTLGEDGLDVIAIGLTFGIVTNDGIQEYWFKTGITKDDITPKGVDDSLAKTVAELAERLKKQEEINATQQTEIDTEVKTEDASEEDINDIWGKTFADNHNAEADEESAQSPTL